MIVGFAIAATVTLSVLFALLVIGAGANDPDAKAKMGLVLFLQMSALLCAAAAGSLIVLAGGAA